MHKFTQHEDLADRLIATEEKKLGEATKSKVWGIGLSMWDSNATDSMKWVGANRQGSILEEVRKELKKKREK